MDPLLAGVAALLGLPFAVFVALALVQRSRFRALAEKLGARHAGINPITPGAIVGDGFRIETVRSQKTYRTEVHVRAPHARGPCVLQLGFFRGAPNWSCAKVPGSRAERVFLWEVRLPALAQPTRDQEAELLAWLPEAAELEDLRAALEAAEVSEIRVADGTISTSLRGIASDPTRLQHTLDALGSLASATPARRRSSPRAA